MPLQPMPPHLKAQGVKPREWRDFLDLLARHKAIAEAKKSLLPAGRDSRPLPPSMKNPAAFSFHGGVHGRGQA